MVSDTGSDDAANVDTKPAWGMAFAWLITVLWIIAGALYVKLNDGWQFFVRLQPNDLGSWFSGLFAPLAFFWLIVGYYLQRQELYLQRKELRLQREETSRLATEAERQAKAIEAAELHARRDTFLAIYEVAIEQLTQLCDLISSWHVDGLRRKQCWQQFQAGNRAEFFELIIQLTVQGRDKQFKENVEKVMNGWYLVHQYCERFEWLLDEASACDPSKKIRQLCETSAAANAYRMLCFCYERTPRFEHQVVVRDAPRPS